MNLLNRRLFFLVVLCGASLFGVYRTCLQHVEKNLTQLLNAPTDIDSVRLAANAQVLAAQGITVSATDHAGLSIGHIKLQPHVSGIGFEKAIAFDINMDSYDDWSQNLDRLQTTLGDIDPIVKTLPSVTSLNIADETEKALVPLLASWRSEWQAIVGSYQQSIERSTVPVISEEVALQNRNNPLRDRELLQAQIESIEKLTVEFEKIQSELDLAKEKLVAKSDSILSQSSSSIEAKLKEHETNARQTQRMRFVKNLEAIRGRFYADLLSRAMSSQHVASNVALRCSQTVVGNWSSTSERGTDYLAFMPDPATKQIDCLELSGNCSSQSAVNRFVCALYRKENIVDAWADFVIIVSPNSGATQRYVGKVEPDGKCTYTGNIEFKNIEINSTLLTEPNFALEVESANVQLESIVDTSFQELVLSLDAPRVKLNARINDPNFQAMFVGDPLIQEMCTATLSVKLRKNGIIECSAHQEDNFFAKFQETAVDQIDKLNSTVMRQLAEQNDALKLKVAKELAMASQSLSALSQQLALQREQHQSRATLIADRLAPTEFRTATSGSKNIK